MPLCPQPFTLHTGVTAGTGSTMSKPTSKLASLAARAAARRREGAQPRLEPHPEDRLKPFPLSDMQQAYWIGRSQDLRGGGVAMQSCVDIDCPALDLTRFRQALNALVARHDMLRAVVTGDGRQRVLPLPLDFPVAVEDLSNLSPEERDHALEALAQTMSATVSDLSRWPQSEVRFSRFARNADGTERGVLHFRWDMWATDGRSFQILYEDLAALYLGQEETLPPLPVTFRDCMLAQKAFEETPAYATSLDFWRSRLAGLPPAPDFPRSSAAVADTLTVKRYEDRLTVEETAVILDRCAAEGISPTGLLAALYAEVIAFWTGSRRFTLNMPRFNRNLRWHECVNHIMGEFATFTLVAVDMDAATDLLSRAKAMQRSLWDSLDHAEVSGVRLLRELARTRGGLDAEAMPVIFTAMPARKSGDRGVEQVLEAFGQVRRTHGSTPQTILDCQYTVFNDALHVYWDARLASFPAGMTDAMFAGFTRLARQLAHDPAVWTAAAPAALPASQARVRNARNNRPLDLPAGTVCSMLLHHAAARPEAPAILSRERCLTWGETLHLALKIRARLLELLPAGGRTRRQGRPVSCAIVQERGWRAIASILGVELAGLPYLPLDCSNPDPRLTSMLRVGNAAVILADRPNLARFRDAALPVLDVQAVLEEESRPAPPVEDTLPDQGDPAYIILTSGTTGTPKAVVVSHYNVLNLCCATNRTFAMSANDRILAATALHHDLSVYDIFGAASLGCGLILLPHDEALDPDTWIACCRDYGATFWNSVPAFIKLLAQRCLERGVTLGIRLFTAGGDWVERGLPELARRASPGAVFYSIGGPTETTVWNVMHRVEQDLPAGWNVIPYGAATENNSYYLLDAQLRDVPDWTPGEMYCAGANVCSDIWAEDGKERFCTHPSTGERLYRTGDVGRFHDDGLIEILGRADFQVNISGYRLDPAEIEGALNTHPAVERAVVVPLGQDRGSSGRTLAAFLLPAGGEVMPGGDDFAAWLRGRLPPQMIPGIWKTVDAFPLTANGKVDRRALMAESAAVEETTHDHAGDRDPQTPLERLLAELWSGVLGVDVPGVRANFFRLGGDSLKAVQILTRLKERLPVPLTLASFFAAPTIEGLSGAVISSINARVRTGDRP